MSMELVSVLRFTARRFLPRLPEDHVCRSMHSHRFRVEVRICAALDTNLEWIADYADVERLCRDTLRVLDGQCLNDVSGLENPTSENVARWLWQKLSVRLEGLKHIAVWETPQRGVRYDGKETL